MQINPGENGIAVRDYFAAKPSDIAGQLVAMLQDESRIGLHNRLGNFPGNEIAGSENEQMRIPIDIEPRNASVRETFTRTAGAVDFLATYDAA